MPTDIPFHPSRLSERALRRAIAGVIGSEQPHLLLHARVRGLSEYRAWFGSAPADALHRLLHQRLAVLETPTARTFALGRLEFAVLVAADAAELEDWREDVLLALGLAGRSFHLSFGCGAVVLPSDAVRPGQVIAQVRRESAAAPELAGGFTPPSRALIADAYSPDATAQDLGRALALRLGAPSGWLPLAAAAHAAGSAAIPSELLARRDTADPAERRMLELQGAVGRHLMRADSRLAPGERLLSASAAPWRDAPLEARILATVLEYTELTEAHTHGDAMSTWDALTVLRHEAGDRHDPRVVDALIAELASRAAAGFRAPVERTVEPAGRIGARRLAHA